MVIMKVLELFCGTKSVSKAFEKRGHKTFTIDNDPQHEPDWCVDILDIDTHELRKRLFNKGMDEVDVIWASPPCQTFSVLVISKYWDERKQPKLAKTYIGLAMVKRTMEIIGEFKPSHYFIENPRGMLRKQQMMADLPRKTVTYCQYGAKYRKPTDIWTNANHWIPKRVCNNGESCHVRSERGARKGLQDTELSLIPNWDGKGSVQRTIIPEQLCNEIVDVCEDRQNIKQLEVDRKW